MIREIDILGVKFSVEEVDVVNKFEPRRGQIDYMTGEIKIDKSLPEKMKGQVLMHEILHATFDLLGYDDLRDDEEKVQGIATALHQIIASQVIFS